VSFTLLDVLACGFSALPLWQEGIALSGACSSASRSVWARCRAARHSSRPKPGARDR